MDGCADFWIGGLVDLQICGFVGLWVLDMANDAATDDLLIVFIN